METLNEWNKVLSQVEITEGLMKAVKEVSQEIKPTNDVKFIEKQGEKWSISENLQHLITSNKAVDNGLTAPKAVLDAFGKPEAPSRTLTNIIEIYKEALKAGGKAPAKYAPKADKIEKLVLLEKWEILAEKMIKDIKEWSEEDLDIYVMPHPLLGNLTVREMLMFTIYHIYHHLETIKNINKT